jgi:hypothetical protein
MEKIIEKRQTIVRSRVFTLENVRALAKTLAAQYASLPEENKPRADINFTIRCDDGSSYESRDIELLAEGSVITQKRVTHVTLSYWYFPSNSRIEVALRHGSEEGTITVNGSDRMWVAGVLDSLEGLCKSFRPQSNPYKKNPRLIDFAAAMGIGSILFFVLSFIPVTASSKQDGQDYLWLKNALMAFPFLGHVIKYAIVWFLGMPWTSSLKGRFTSLWPSIELEIGPEHLLTEKLRRKLLSQVLALAVVPIALSVIYDVAKALSGH